MKRLLLTILLFSFIGNVGLFWFAKEQYKAANAVRLDPLQITLYDEQLPLKQEGQLRVVFFGDSRTQGWPSPTIEHVEFINRGIGNQTSEQIRLRYEEHLQPLRADVVILQLCVNDLKTIPLFPQNRDAIVDQCKRNLLAIINKANTEGTTVIVTTVFPVGKVPPERYLVWSDEVTPAIQEVNQFIVEQANENVIVWNTYTLLEGEKGVIRPEYSRDLLHLNQQGYQVLNQQLKRLLESNFQ